ncbi:MAG TPA: MBG domain-containing protein [Kiritimatiellia bacterium]|nr:MBG domain-containing protein [Kiritimatiellia bacterium]
MAALAFPLSAAAAPAAKDGDGTLSVAPATVAAASADNRLEFQFRNDNRGSFNAGAQFELTVPAGWTAPQAADPSAPGFVEVFSTAGTASAAVSSVSGSGPWRIAVDFTAAKGAVNGFGLAYGGAAAPAAIGTQTFAARTHQAGGAFVALDASPAVAVVPVQAGVTLGNLLQVYDGTPRAVTVQTDPVGLAVAVTYDGVPEAPVATGLYAVVATVVSPGYAGSASGLLVVREAGGGDPVFGLETFENFAPAAGGYQSGTFLGQDGSVWSYAQASADESIAGRSPTLAKAKGAFIRSGILPGGVGTVSLKFRKAGNQKVACGVLVNGVQIGTISGGDSSVQTWTSGPVGVAGEFTLAFSNNVNAGAITLDDVAWTGYKLPATVALAGLAQTYDGTPRAATAQTEPAGLAVEIAYDGSATAPTAAGIYAVVATVVDGVYGGSVSGTLTVAKADQTLDFAAIPDSAVFQKVNLAAAASSGLPVAFAVGFGPAAIAADGATVSFTDTGRVAIVAAQAGDANWNAVSATREFEVLPAFALSADQINVRENGEGRFFVRLNGAPASNVVVSVARVGGDGDLRVKSGASLAFGPANWDWWQAVTLAATNDDDKAGGTATFRVSLPGSEPRMVAAMELDDDVGENLAAATNGATISGGLNPGRAIDGIHASSGNYGGLFWTDNPPGALTLALKAPSSVSRIRVLNWNWLYPVLHRYLIESSLDGTNWTVLVDASATDRHGWDDWEIPEQTARYLRLTGLANSANPLVCISEWEVIGKRLPVPANVVLQNLRQTYDGRPKQVAVQTDPPNLPVAVVYESAALRRRSDPAPEAATEPPVAAGVYAVLAEVADENYEGYAEGTLVVDKASQTISFPPPGHQSAASPMELRAVASSGLPTSYAVVSGPATLDESGVRLTFSGTGTVTVVASQAGDQNWEPAEDVAVTFDVTCPGLCVEVNRANVNVREGGEGRLFVRLTMPPEKSAVVSIAPAGDATNVAVASGAVRTFTAANWDVWQAVTFAAAEDDNGADETARFKISLAGAADRFVTATTLDDDLGPNLALASGGAAIAASKASRAAQLIDGVHNVSTNYGYSIWTNDPPGRFTLDLNGVRTVSRVRLLLWDWIYRTQSYRVESSVDGTNWTVLADASRGDRNGWEDWDVSGQAFRFLRVVGLSSSANPYVLISELEVYGAPPAPLRLGAAAAKGVSAATAAPVVDEPEPVLVLTSEGPADETGWNAVDGDDATAWVGQKAGGGYLVVEYQPTLTLSGLEVDVAETSLADAQVLTSLDGQDWQPLPDDLEAHPVALNFLWIVFPDDGTAAVPEVLEIRPNP